MRGNYEHALIKKLELTPKEIRNQCTGAALMANISASTLIMFLLRL
jgi:hypothetical protein